ncbi:MAG: DNA polymerase I [Clostridia bacterium]|nr:DNA polymerase I [Clostridia bacterium]
MKTLLVIDGNSILNRQFYGIRPLSTKNGLFTNAVFGFTKVLLSQMEKLSPDYVAVAFDLKEKTFRHKEYDAYKAGRHAMPEELAMQFPYAKKTVEALGASVLSLAGYEADDILGTLARMAEQCEEETHAYLLTGDKDSLQLISDKTTVLLAGNHEVTSYTPEVFFEKYGVQSSQFVDVKALMGDSSDNIPGVPGIGEKTALKLIAANGDLDTLFADVDALGLTPSVTKKLKEGKDSAFLSRFLAKIECEAPLGLTLSDIALKKKNKEALAALFCEMEFTAFDKLLADEEGEETAKESLIPAATLVSVEALSMAAPYVLYPHDDKIYLCDGDDPARGFVIDNDSDETLAAILTAAKGACIVWDSKALYHRLGASLAIDFDLLLAAYVLDAGAPSYDPARLSLGYLGEPMAAENPAYTLYRLSIALKQKLSEEGSEELYRSIEAPLAEVLFKMEKRGFMVDLPMLEAFSLTLDIAINTYMEDIYAHAGKKFNINSPKQLGVVFFEDLGLPVLKKTKSGYSTDAEVLEKLRPYHPIIDLVTDYRQAVKFKATYADALAKVADEKGRVHTSFNQTVTATGRLSSTEPNLQNIPVRTPLGKELRRAFRAKDGYLLVDADYSQIELRILAALSGDERMIEAFKSGVDIHAVTASQVFDIPLEDVTPELRSRAKAVNFGIVYGIGAFSLAGDIGVSMKEASQYIKNYKDTYQKVDEYLKKLIEDGKSLGYVSTHFNRRRYIPELTATKAVTRAFGERVAMNSPIQGTAADVIKVAMLRVEEALAREGLSAKLILQVHDELIVEAPEAEAEPAAAIVKREMEGAVSFSVPLTVEVSVGKTWYDCK